MKAEVVSLHGLLTDEGAESEEWWEFEGLLGVSQVDVGGGEGEFVDLQTQLGWKVIRDGEGDSWGSVLVVEDELMLRGGTRELAMRLVA